MPKRKLNEEKDEQCKPYRLHRVPEYDPESSEYYDFKESCYCFIYAYTDKKFKNYKLTAIILMQMRFDGYFSLIGGDLQDGETSWEAMNRELWEQINWGSKDHKKGPLTKKDYQHAFIFELQRKIEYIYAIKVSECMISKIEKNALNAGYFGTKSLGLIRVPLYTMEGGVRGFPVFLKHLFLGKYQLTECLVDLGIVSKEYINKVKSNSN